MRTPILDQPLISVADGHEEKVDRYRGDDRPIWTVDIAHGKERVGNCNIGFDETDTIVGERCLCTAVDGLLRLGTEVLHHGDSPLQKVTHRRYEGSIFGEQRRSRIRIFLNESFSEVISECTNGCFVASRAGARRARRADDERTCEKREAETLRQASES